MRRQPPTAEQAAANFAVMCNIGGLPGHVDRMQEVTLLIPGPAYHSSPNGWLFTLFKMGANLCIESRFDPARMLARIAADSITHVLAVPTLFVRLLALDVTNIDRAEIGCSRPQSGPSEAADHPHPTRPRGSGRVACPVVAEVLVALAQQLADTLAVAAEA